MARLPGRLTAAQAEQSQFKIADGGLGLRRRGGAYGADASDADLRAVYDGGGREARRAAATLGSACGLAARARRPATADAPVLGSRRAYGRVAGCGRGARGPRPGATALEVRSRKGQHLDDVV